MHVSVTVRWLSIAWEQISTETIQMHSNEPNLINTKNKMKVRKIQDCIKSYALLQHMFRTKYWTQETEGSDIDLIQEVSSMLHEVLEEIFNVM